MLSLSLCICVDVNLRLSNSDKHNVDLSQLRQIQTDYEELLNEKAKLQVWPWGFFNIYVYILL